jgi:hypothetical protein
VVEQLMAQSQTSFIARTLGRYDVLVTLGAYDRTDLVESVEAIRAIPGVNEVHCWTHLRVVKETYASAGLGPLTTAGSASVDHG